MNTADLILAAAALASARLIYLILNIVTAPRITIRPMPEKPEHQNGWY